MKKLVAFLMAAVLSAGMFAGCAGKPIAGKDAATDGKFVVGVDDSFAPMGFRDENNEIVGFDIDLAKEAGARMGQEVVIQPINWDNKVLELNNGNIDVIWNGFTITEQRKQEVLFTKPYLKNNQVIVVQAASDIAAKADLEGKKIGLQTGSSAQDALEADEIKDKVTANGYEDNALALTDLKTGRIDAVIVDEVVAKYYVSKESDAFRLLDESLAAEEYGVGVKMGNDTFLNELQAVIDEMNADGTAAKISEKWFGEDIVLK